MLRIAFNIVSPSFNAGGSERHSFPHSLFRRDAQICCSCSIFHCENVYSCHSLVQILSVIVKKKSPGRKKKILYSFIAVFVKNTQINCEKNSDDFYQNSILFRRTQRYRSAVDLQSGRNKKYWTAVVVCPFVQCPPPPF